MTRFTARFFSVLPLDARPASAAGPGRARVVQVLSGGGCGGVGLLLRLRLAGHDLDVRYVDEVAVVLAKCDVLQKLIR